jgi:catechol 2,3-dioxygenase-like lactoylglutathione lyase family enzyme
MTSSAGSAEFTMRHNHVTLIISDLDASLRFYEKLGLRPIVLAEPRYARMVFPDGDGTLSLEVTGEAAQPSRVQLYFECLDLDAVWARREEQ